MPTANHQVGRGRMAHSPQLKLKPAPRTATISPMRFLGCFSSPQTSYVLDYLVLNLFYTDFLKSNISTPAHHNITLWHQALIHTMYFKMVCTIFVCCEARFSRALLVCFLSFIYSVFTYKLKLLLPKPGDRQTDRQKND